MDRGTQGRAGGFLFNHGFRGGHGPSFAGASDGQVRKDGISIREIRAIRGSISLAWRDNRAGAKNI
jgi:hypothetical protein